MAFWIISIFLSVVTLHPIILTYVRPPKDQPSQRRASDRLYEGVSRGLIALGQGNLRYAVVVLFAVTMGFGLYFAHHLKTGDTEPGAALMYHDHPYNVAFRKLNAVDTGVEGPSGQTYGEIGVQQCIDEATRLAAEPKERQRKAAGHRQIRRREPIRPLRVARHVFALQARLSRDRVLRKGPHPLVRDHRKTLWFFRRDSC